MRRELSMLYSRFYGCLLAGIVLIYQMQHFSGTLHPTKSHMETDIIHKLGSMKFTTQNDIY